MQITIKAHQTQLNQKDTLQMERRIHFALGRFANGIDRIRVRLTDSNGPKGGPDKECLIVVKLRKGGEIVVQGKGMKNGTVLNRCADRISRAVDHELSRRWRKPIRRRRRVHDAEMTAIFESEERINDTFEQNSMTLDLPDTLLLTSGRVEQKLITQSEKKGQEDSLL